MSEHDVYRTPLVSRYSSDKMKYLFSDDNRYQLWRKLWTALAETEMKMGLPITLKQVEQLKRHITDIDYDVVAKREKEVRHDVMAHIYAYGKAAPDAAGIIHLGATSCYVTDNADLIIYRDALGIIRTRLQSVISELSGFADRYKDLPALGYTHYQPAQLITVGKRACLWLQDMCTDLGQLDNVLDEMCFLGCRGTTGTEASFMHLFDNDENRIDEMNNMLASQFGFKKCYSITSQTYPRKTDVLIGNALSLIAQSCHRMAQDIRLLQHDREIDEPFEDTQIGSSAMAYKRNPMRCERICSLSRYLIMEAANPALTASRQWLERTLDDSANRRITMPELFLCADSILILANNVVSGLKVNEKIISARVREYLPFMITENLMMEAVKKGADRQQVHEIIRQCSMEAVRQMKEGRPCDLLERLAQNPEFTLDSTEMESLMQPERYTGRCSSQVTAYLKEIESLTEGIDSSKEDIEL